MPSLSEAVERIKKDLGPEAVILSTRKAPMGNKWWQRGAAKLEVTAAIDVDDNRRVEHDRPAPMLGQTMRLIKQMTEEQLSPLKQEILQLRRTLTTPDIDSIEAVHEEQPIENRKQAVEPKISVANHNGAILKNHSSLMGKQSPSTNEKAEVATDTVTNEADNLTKAAKENPFIKEVCRGLLWHRVSAKIVNHLSQYLHTLETIVSEDHAREQAAEWLMVNLPDVAAHHKMGTDSRIFTVVGPTGSGKTTTLVKLASRLALQEDKKVGFITLDHFRIGAEEQLQMYARILNAPCEMATNAKELQDIIKSFASLDMIFIDTEGRSPYDSQGIEKLSKMLDFKESASCALVIPSILQSPDVNNVVAQFSPTHFDNIIVTKLDETICFGSLFNVSAATKLPLSYFSTGQQVPEDLEEASKERVVDCLLNFSGNYPIPKAEQLTTKTDATNNLNLQ